MVKHGEGETTLDHVLSPTPSVRISAEKLMSIVNDWRYSQGLQPYTKDARLCDLASERISEIQLDYSHNGFLKREKNRAFGFYYEKLGENLAQGYQSPDETLKAWLISPEHLENLSYNYKYSCLKCENTFCAQEFANF